MVLESNLLAKRHKLVSNDDQAVTILEAVGRTDADTILEVRVNLS